MNTRWGITICCNVVLFGMLCWHRPERMRWLWASQTFVLFCTVVNVWGWYHFTDAHYNTVWTALDIAQAWFEGNVLLRLMFNDGVTVTAAVLAIHLIYWVSEYRVWFEFADEDGLHFQILRQWINVIAIAMLCYAVYYRSKRNQRSGETSDKA